jgi:hypothetical protein
VENLLVVTVVVDVSSNQFRIPYHAAYVWPTLKQKIPLVFNLAVHLSLFALRGEGTSFHLFYTVLRIKFIFWKSYYLVFHKFLSQRKALFLRFVANGTFTSHRLAHLLEEALNKGFERLLHFPAATTGEEKCSRFSFDRLA